MSFRHPFPLGFVPSESVRVSTSYAYDAAHLAEPLRAVATLTSQEEPEKPIPYQTEGRDAVTTAYVLVARSPNDPNDWAAVRVGTRDVDTHNVTYFREVDDTLRDLWRRIVVDGTMPWDSSYDRNSLRLVQIEIRMRDASEELFEEGEDRGAQARRIAVSKLSAEDARALGPDIEVEFTKMLMQRLPLDETANRALLKRIRSDATTRDTIFEWHRAFNL